MSKQTKIQSLLVECGMMTVDAGPAALMLGQIDIGKFVGLAERRLTDFPEWLSATESKIIGTLLDTILARPGMSVEVHDECEKMLERTRDRSAIEKETAASSCTYYIVFQDDKRLGYIWLIHGNENDVISDYAVNPILDELIAPATKLSEEIG